MRCIYNPHDPDIDKKRRLMVRNNVKFRLLTSNSFQLSDGSYQSPMCLYWPNDGIIEEELKVYCFIKILDYEIFDPEPKKQPILKIYKLLITKSREVRNLYIKWTVHQGQYRFKLSRTILSLLSSFRKIKIRKSEPRNVGSQIQMKMKTNQKVIL